MREQHGVTSVTFVRRSYNSTTLSMFRRRIGDVFARTTVDPEQDRWYRDNGGSIHLRPLLKNDLTVSTFGLSPTVRDFSYLLATVPLSTTDTRINPREVQLKNIQWPIDCKSKSISSRERKCDFVATSDRFVEKLDIFFLSKLSTQFWRILEIDGTGYNNLKMIRE